MRIQHNITAMNSYRNYTNNTSAVAKNLEKLSSGYKINRAGDDAAGLAISEKMRAQITGLKTAQKNAKDGISLVKTGEGALTEVHDMLNRMYELAEQSSNGTYDNEVDRANLQKEITSLKSEIDRIADSVNFNGINLLDGSLAGGASGSGGLKGAVITSFKSATTGAVAAATTAATALGSETVTIDGVEITVDWSKISPDDQTALKKNWTASTATDAKKAAEIIQKTLNDAIDKTNAEKGTNVNHVTVKSTNAGVGGAAGASSFELISGLEGSGNSSIKIATGGNLLTTMFTSGSAAVPGTAAVAPTAPAATSFLGGTLTISNLAFVATNGTNLNAAQASTLNNLMDALKTKGITYTDDSTNVTASLDGYVLKTKTTGAAAYVEGAGAHELEIFASDGTTKLASFTVTTAGVTAAGTTTANAKFTDGTPAVAETPAVAGGAVSVSATDKFTGDEADVNGVHFNMMVDGEAVDINVIGIAAGDTGANVAAALKTGIDAALGNYATAKGLTADETADLRASITVGFNSEGRLEITNNSGKSLGFEDKDGGKAAELLGISSSSGQATSGGLTLQIGDTADSFNKLTVSIKDMHANAMGIGNVDISKQGGASVAMKSIKSAINYVSDVRGDLGATQNRLEHTINNLSVMQENIQDAESSIRDVDVAEEMMAYTKNNILVQSAQAMLAQANQLPQGVLQLLQ